MNIVNVRISKGYGGAENYIYYIFKSISSSSGLNVLHITNNIQLFRNLRYARLNTLYLDSSIDEIGTKRELLKLILNIGKYIYSYFKIAMASMKHNADIIIFHSMTEKLLLTAIFKVLGYKVVWFEHGPLYSSTRAIYIKYFYKFVSRFVNKIFVVSIDTKKDLIRGGILKNKIVVMYVGVDLARFNIRRKISKQIVTVGYLGNLNPIKGIDRFVRVAELLSSEKETFRFIIIGEGEKKYINNVNKKYRSYFTFTGYTAQIEKYLKKIDILFFPTEHYEGIPLSILEAMAMNICVVSKNIGGINEVIDHNYDGILYNRFDAEECKSILLSISMNKEKRTKIQNNARKKINSKFNLKNQSEIFKNLIYKL